MKNNSTILAAVAALVGGFGLGNVLAQTGERLEFQKADLFTCASRLHRERNRDFLFANPSPRAKTFEIDAGSVDETIRDVAKAFGRRASVVAGVVVFEDGMRERSTATERLDELNAWLLANFPASEGRREMGQSDAFRVFLLATQADAKSLWSSLGPDKQMRFGELPQQQQQAVLDLARAAKWTHAATTMASLLDQWSQEIHRKR